MESLSTRARQVIDRHITPAGRIQEIIYALIMVLTVTSTVSRTVPDSEEGIRTLFLAVIGCNIAWGMVDGVMYILTNLFNRNRALKMVRDASNAFTEDDALSIIDGEFNPPFEWMLDDGQKRRLNEEIMEHVIRMRPSEVKVRRQDLLGGVFCFVVTFLTTLPAVVPFLMIQEMEAAIRVSNVIALTMLFLAGVEYARFTGKNLIKTGAGLAFLGVAIVLVTIVLGG